MGAAHYHRVVVWLRNQCQPPSRDKTGSDRTAQKADAHRPPGRGAAGGLKQIAAVATGHRGTRFALVIWWGIFARPGVKKQGTAPPGVPIRANPIFIVWIMDFLKPNRYL